LEEGILKKAGMNVVKRNMKVIGAIIHDIFVRFVGGGRGPFAI